MNNTRLWTLLCATWLTLTACQASEPPASQADAGQTSARTDGGVHQAEDARPTSPRLTGFFEPGNFATVTVPSPQAQGKPEALSIKSLDVRVTLVGRMARTQVTQVFHNHTPRRTEGSYEFTLPMGAAISRLSMDVEGKMMEGELVEREKARQIYEQIVRRKKDPALLEWQGGQRFKTQIFPIEANSDKKVVLSYEQLLPMNAGATQYLYDLPNLSGQPAGSTFGTFKFELLAEDARALKVTGYEASVEQRDVGGTVSFDAARFKPTGPLRVALRPQGEGGLSVRYATRKDEQFFAVDLTPKLPEAQQQGAQHLVVALDTSAGIGDVELKRAGQVARALIEGLPAEARVQVVSGDHRVRQCAPAPMSSDAALGCLKDLKAGGGTDLNGLLQKAAEASLSFEGSTTVVVFTDGAASLGELDGDLIRSRLVERLQGREVSLHTVAMGHAPDEGYLAKLASVNRGHAVRMTPQDDAGALSQRLASLVREPLMTDVTVSVVSGEVQGLTPHQPVNLARGEAMAVMGRLDKGAATLQIKGTWRGKTLTKDLTLTPDGKAGDPLLVNFWARSVIEEMQEQSIPRDRVVATSLEYGVMSRYTSFLVLENEEAYKRFQVERRKERARQEAEQALAQGNLKKGKGKLQDMLASAETKAEGDEGTFDEAEEAVADDGPADGSDDGDDDDDDDDDEEEEPRSVPTPPPTSNKKVATRALDTLNESPIAASYKGSPSSVERDFNGKMAGSGRTGEAFGMGAMGGGPGGLGVASRGIGTAGRGRGGGGRGGYARSLGQVVLKVKGGRPNVSGGLDMEIIRRVVRRYTRELKSCYEQKLFEDTTLTGELILSFTISNEGRVIAASARGGNIGSSALSSCVENKIRRWVFPEPRDGSIVRVKYPFTFSYRGELIPNFEFNHREIQRLEARRSALSLQEESRLLELYVLNKQKQKARALMTQFRKSTPPEKYNEALLELLNRDILKITYEKLYADTATALLTQPNPPEQVVFIVWNYHAYDGQWATLSKIFGGVKLVPTTASRLLGQLVERQQDKHAEALLEAWLDHDEISTGDAYQILTNDRTLKLIFPKHTYQVTAKLIEEGDSRVAVMEDFITTGLKLEKVSEVAPRVIARCKDTLQAPKSCAKWLPRLSADPTILEMLRKANQAKLSKLTQQRAQDMSNPKLIREAARLLEQTGETEAALRLLSEMVEFAPHDYRSRVRYAQTLVDRQDISGGCAQYAAAVQLNPSERDTFKTMMGLRRNREEASSSVRDCIVNGVSNLPVQRAVSLILTWEDPSADIDLHIMEVGGEEIFYSNRESNHGGLLYYDITDGFGPEIYVLGSGPAGEYKLSLVYYAGSAKNVKGTLTVLRNAGSPQETREHREFVLSAPDTDVQTPIGVFRL